MAPLPMFFFLRLSAAMLLLLPLPPLFPLVAAQVTPSNLTTGSSLTPTGQSTFLLSPSGDFAVGFRGLEYNTSLYVLAVWFEKIPGRTVVWTANGNQPVQVDSRLDLTVGGLVLTDHEGKTVWSTNVGNVTHAAMLDEGNFVLVRAQNTVKAWESFKNPTDTIVPSQVLPPGSRLTSRLMETDFSKGTFQLWVTDFSNNTLQLRVNENRGVLLSQVPPSCTDCKFYDPYWGINTNGVNGEINFSDNGRLIFALQNESSITLTSPKLTYRPTEFYLRATLDVDGALRQYAYPRNLTGEDWMVLASIPEDICVGPHYYAGSRPCGYNSYCNQNGTTGKTNCACPPHYSFVDPVRKYKGCMPDFVPQSCTADGSEEAPTSEFRIEKLPRIDWPSFDYQHLKPLTEKECSNACLSDCYCTVAIHRGNDCWMKRLPLLNGRYDRNDTNAIALLKVPTRPERMRNNRTASNRTPTPPTLTNSPSTRKRGQKTWLFLLLGSSNVLSLAAFFSLTCCIHHKKIWRRVGLSAESSKLGPNLRCFTYNELHAATQGFKDEVGRGAFGTVYKGVVQESGSISGTPIAVKRLQGLDESVDVEFDNEVRIIAQIHHKNLIRLLGYCSEGSRRLLVYEYMPNGSLFDLLLRGSKLEWNTRMELAFGVARGLQYLHDDCSTQIIHCDIKPQNILIDDCFAARISDFGLSKLLRAGQSRTLTDIRGTRGYVAPEWFKNKPITSMVDVYSFGVLLLVIICCRKSVDAEAGESKAVLTYWAYDCYMAGRLDLLVKDEPEPLAEVAKLERSVKIALWCIQEDPALRPTMKMVTEMLEGAAEIAVPPNPSTLTSNPIQL